jgi:Stress responsive A/B Barrel Domain
MAERRVAHNVFFLLKDRTPENMAALNAACHKYLNVQPGIVFFAAGPLVSELTREVNDRDWDVGLHMVFESKAAHDHYQIDAMHQQFISENKATWAKVRVFDSYV